MNKLKEQLCNNIWSSLEDYFRHADSDDIYENISEQFVERLTLDSIKVKHNLRQLFMYRPYNGLLLQSRLYNTSGGTCGAQAESKLYRDLVQREISELEDVPNLWITEKYCGNKHGIYIACGNGFGGYMDWVHPDFDAKISIRQDHAHDYEIFDVGTYGLCISCAGELSSKLLCDDCDHDDCELCQECDNYSSETWEVFNHRGEVIRVFESCLDEHYRLCEHCHEYYPRDTLTITGNGSRVCSQCIADDYAVCDKCDEYFRHNELSEVVNADGDTILICQACREQKAVSA